MDANRTPGRPREFDRAKALRGAMELFWKRGYDATTLADLQTAMGNISPPSFYAAFGSKEEVFVEAVKLYREEVASAVVVALETGETARESIEAMMNAALDMYAASPTSRGCLLIFGAVNTTSPALEALMQDIRREGRDLMRKRLRRGISEGDLPKTAPVETAAAFYTTVMYGVAHGVREGVPIATLRRVVDTAMASWETVLGSAPRRKRARARR